MHYPNADNHYYLKWASGSEELPSLLSLRSLVLSAGLQRLDLLDEDGELSWLRDNIVAARAELDEGMRGGGAPGIP